MNCYIAFSLLRKYNSKNQYSPIIFRFTLLEAIIIELRDNMKIYVTIALFVFSFTAIAQSNRADTIITGITVSFKYSNSIFPESWRVAPISVTAEKITSSEIQRSKAIIVKALTRYPLAAVAADLKSVYILKSITFYDVGHGGTNFTDAIYLANNETEQGYSDLYLEQTFHHEYSSILYRNPPSFIDEDDWKKANIAGFDYNDPEDGVGAIRNNKSSQDLDTALCKNGFLTQYSLSGIENDINTFAQNIFSPSPGFWEIAGQYPRISKKVKLLIAFYNKIHPSFTEDYFRKLKN